LEKAITTSCECKRLVLSWGNFEIEKELDLSKATSGMEMLSFHRAGLFNRYNHWNEHPERLNNIRNDSSDFI
jgi:hypothetical protein